MDVNYKAYLDEDLVGLGLVELDVLKDERGFDFGEDEGLRLHSNSGKAEMSRRGARRKAEVVKQPPRFPGARRDEGGGRSGAGKM